MRSFLFVPADSEKKLAKGLASAADALILDLEDSVVADRKPLAREMARQFLAEHAGQIPRPSCVVRINARDTGLIDSDLDAVMPSRPDAVMLPKAEGGGDVSYLDAQLTLREQGHGIPIGHTRIIVVATETARAIFQLGTYAGASERLSGLTWGAEDLSASVGARTARHADGSYTDVFRLARALTVLAASAAETVAIDTVFPNFRNTEGFRRECEAAERDGFTAKMAIHPDQVAVINEVFTPSAEAVARSKAVVEAFRAAGNPGVVAIDGKMYDRPHLRLAERLLARAGVQG